MESGNFGIWTAVVRNAATSVMDRLERMIDLEDPPDFYEFARLQRELAANQGDSTGWDLLMEGQIVLMAVGHPTALTSRQALDLAQTALQSDPLFETKLLRRLMSHRLWPEEVPAAEIMRNLLVMEALLDPSRMTFTLLKFAKHPDALVQAKVAKILGRYLDNMDLLDEFFGQSDNRVRANLVEGIGQRAKLKGLGDLLHRASVDHDQSISSMALAIKAKDGDKASLPKIRMRTRSQVDSVRHPPPYPTLLLFRA